MSDRGHVLPTEPVVVTTTVDEAVRSIRAAMFAGRVAPGAALKENELAQSLGVSRGTVREAIRVLGGEGLVQHTANKGAVVTKATRESLEDIFDARKVCELGVVDALFSYSAAKRRSVYADNIVALRETIDLMRRAAEEKDVEGVFSYDMHFHGFLVGMLNNQRVLDFYQRAQAELRLVANRADRKADLDEFAPSHQMLLDEILGSSKSAARSAVMAHLRDGHAKFELARKALLSLSSDT